MGWGENTAGAVPCTEQNQSTGPGGERAPQGHYELTLARKPGEGIQAAILAWNISNASDVVQPRSSAQGSG